MFTFTKICFTWARQKFVSFVMIYCFTMLLHFSQTLFKTLQNLFTFLPHVPSGLAPSHVVSVGGSVRLCQQWLTSLSELSDSTLLTRYPLLRFMSGFVDVSILTASVTSLFIVVS